ncbi:hypothetical protein PCANC_03451 [Puccinia coronata f. sp. avenae]|uniref:Uncharacterized protein n=1 Tax=Puccinia coronata f. sp. avenae TaxID=200324 RepID=A0A2N5W2E8_9BASI|nr:hypothetical protein PCANC_03451 [Puccinia coronata f. sp. avenae]
MSLKFSTFESKMISRELRETWASCSEHAETFLGEHRSGYSGARLSSLAAAAALGCPNRSLPGAKAQG